jgi:7-carboxy-7-deazaguanine synthase
MGLIIKEIFESIQGEGDKAGVITDFIRLAGCDINCPIKKNCDTDYINGINIEEDEIIKQINNKIVTITGGEPLEQSIYDLCRKLCKAHHFIHIQTSGLIDMSKDLFAHTHFVVCSPKAPVKKLKLHKVDEIKVVNCGQDIAQYYQYGNANYNYIQPYEIRGKYNIKECIDKIKELGKIGQNWRLSLQSHKLIGLK